MGVNGTSAGGSALCQRIGRIQIRQHHRANTGAKPDEISPIERGYPGAIEIVCHVSPPAGKLANYSRALKD